MARNALHSLLEGCASCPLRITFVVVVEFELGLSRRRRAGDVLVLGQLRLAA